METPSNRLFFADAPFYIFIILQKNKKNVGGRVCKIFHSASPLLQTNSNGIVWQRFCELSPDLGPIRVFVAVCLGFVTPMSKRNDNLADLRVPLKEKNLSPLRTPQ